MRVLMPRVRLTVRWLMVVVAVVACGSAWKRWHDEMGARRDSFKFSASYHAEMESRHLGWSVPHKGWLGMVAKIPEVALYHRQRAAFHGNLRRKYERAARYPWLPVEPDPPPPD